MRTQDSLILGNAVQTILAAQQESMPTITEYMFEREVVDILANPFGAEALRVYSHYVGELTKPLNVVDNTDRSKVLFTVPALVQAPIPTIPTQYGISTRQFLQTLNRDIDLGGFGVNDKLKAFMLSITKVPNYLETVIVPIKAIVEQYGRKMVYIPALGEDKPSPPLTVVDTPAPNTQSFMDEYDD